VKPFLKKETEPGVVRTAMADVDRFLPVLDHQLAGREFILGDLTIADFTVVPWLEAAPRLGVGLGGYPNISSWLARMKARPSWADTDTARRA
jgi:GST-like protein